MTRLSILAFSLLVSLPVAARAQQGSAEATARKFLDKGAALYDAKDAPGLAATYTEDAQIHWVNRDESAGEVKESVKSGRAEIESFYREVFAGSQEKATSRNNVDYARFVTPDLLVVQGTFQPDVSKTGKYPFVQVRVRKGDRWLMKSLTFFVFSQD
jgi:hypothetical protein